MYKKKEVKIGLRREQIIAPKAVENFSQHIQISMTTHGGPLENAMAERVNGIIKDEYLTHYQVSCLQEAKTKLGESC